MIIITEELLTAALADQRAELDAKGCIELFAAQAMGVEGLRKIQLDAHLENDHAIFSIKDLSCGVLDTVIITKVERIVVKVFNDYVTELFA